jgi:hypothetical protein
MHRGAGSGDSFHAQSDSLLEALEVCSVLSGESFADRSFPLHAAELRDPSSAEPWPVDTRRHLKPRNYHDAKPHQAKIRAKPPRASVLLEESGLSDSPAKPPPLPSHGAALPDPPAPDGVAPSPEQLASAILFTATRSFHSLLDAITAWHDPPAAAAADARHDEAAFVARYGGRTHFDWFAAGRHRDPPPAAAANAAAARGGRRGAGGRHRQGMTAGAYEAYARHVGLVPHVLRIEEARRAWAGPDGPGDSDDVVGQRERERERERGEGCEGARERGSEKGRVQRCNHRAQGRSHRIHAPSRW